MGHKVEKECEFIDVSVYNIVGNVGVGLGVYNDEVRILEYVKKGFAIIFVDNNDSRCL